MEPVCASDAKCPGKPASPNHASSAASVLLPDNDQKIKSPGPVVQLTREFFITALLCIMLLVITLTITFFPHITYSITMLINYIGVQLGLCRGVNFC